MTELKSIYIENFMSIGKALLEFDDRNIISICGYNDSGKSAIIRLIDIMFYNSYSTEQVHYIKDGADYFKCIITFKDGVEYERIKTQTGSSIFILRKDGNVLFDNRKGSQVINTDGVPKVISDYLGVIRDDFTKEELNVRRCTDRLFLIETTGGDNYKILNVVLQSDRLAETSNAINVDKNKLQSEIVVKYNQLAALKDERERIKVLSAGDLDEFDAHIDAVEALNDRYKSLSAITESKCRIDSIKIPPQLKQIDTHRMKSLSNLLSLCNKASTSIPSEVQGVDTHRLSDIQRLKDLYKGTQKSIPSEAHGVDTECLLSLQRLKSLHNQATAPLPNGVTSVSTDRYFDIKTLKVALDNAKSAETKFRGINDAYSRTRDALITFANSNGLTICSNCGAVIPKEMENRHHE